MIVAVCHQKTWIIAMSFCIWLQSYVSDIPRIINLKIMNEAIFILEKEKRLLEECLKGWKSKSHPEAFKQRNKKLAEICKGIELLKTKNI